MNILFRMQCFSYKEGFELKCFRHNSLFTEKAKLCQLMGGRTIYPVARSPTSYTDSCPRFWALESSSGTCIPDNVGDNILYL